MLAAVHNAYWPPHNGINSSFVTGRPCDAAKLGVTCVLTRYNFHHSQVVRLPTLSDNIHRLYVSWFTPRDSTQLCTSAIIPDLSAYKPVVFAAGAATSHTYLYIVTAWDRL